MGKPNQAQVSRSTQLFGCLFAPQPSTRPVPLLPLQAQGAARQPADASSSGPAGTSSYTPFPFAVPKVDLDVSIAPGATRVTSVVDYVPLDSSSRTCQQLQLRGEDLELLELCLDGERSRTETG